MMEVIEVPSDESTRGTERSATAEEIREWEEEHDEPHPVFEVPHRPERKNLKEEKALEKLAEEIRRWADQHGHDLSAMSEIERLLGIDGGQADE